MKRTRTTDDPEENPPKSRKMGESSHPTRDPHQQRQVREQIFARRRGPAATSALPHSVGEKKVAYDQGQTPPRDRKPFPKTRTRNPDARDENATETTGDQNHATPRGSPAAPTSSTRPETHNNTRHPSRQPLRTPSPQQQHDEHEYDYTANWHGQQSAQDSPQRIQRGNQRFSQEQQRQTRKEIQETQEEFDDIVQEYDENDGAEQEDNDGTGLYSGAGGGDLGADGEEGGDDFTQETDGWTPCESPNVTRIREHYGVLKRGERCFGCGYGRICPKTAVDRYNTMLAFFYERMRTTDRVELVALLHTFYETKIRAPLNKKAKNRSMQLPEWRPIMIFHHFWDHMTTDYVVGERFRQDMVEHMRQFMNYGLYQKNSAGKIWPVVHPQVLKTLHSGLAAWARLSKELEKNNPFGRTEMYIPRPKEPTFILNADCLSLVGDVTEE